MEWISIAIVLGLAENILFVQYFGADPLLLKPKRLRYACLYAALLVVVLPIVALLGRLLSIVLPSPINIWIVMLILIGISSYIMRYTWVTTIKPTQQAAPLFLANPTVIGVTLIVFKMPEWSITHAILYSIGMGISVLIVVFLLANIHIKLRLLNPPKLWSGLPLELLSCALLAIAFSAF